MKLSAKGFTLIELLVVIAIIGILASIVLVSLSSAKTQAKDVSIKEELNQARTAIEVYGSTNGNYGTLADGSSACPTTSAGSGTVFYDDVTTRQIITQMNVLDSNNTICASGSAPAKSWAIAALLSTNVYWCADSSGHLGLGTTHKDIFLAFAEYFIPVAYAGGGPTPPNLQGGSGTAASCP